MSPNSDDHVPSEEELLTPTFVRTRYPEQPTPPPARFKLAPIFAAGTVAWIVVLVVLLAFEGRLVTRGEDWWITCAWYGIGIGLLGTVTMFFRDRKQMSRPNSAKLNSTSSNLTSSNSTS